MRLGRLEPAAAVALGDRRLRGRAAARARSRAPTLTVVVEDPGAWIARACGKRLASRPATARPRPTSTSTTSATRPPTPSSIAPPCARPGVVVLHEWSLHHLVLHETVERGDAARLPARDAPRPRRARARFVGRQVARGAGRATCCPALLPAERPRAGARAWPWSASPARRARARRAAAARPARAAPAASPVAAPRSAALAGGGARARSACPQDALLVTAPGPGHRRQAASTRRCGRWPACARAIPGLLPRGGRRRRSRACRSRSGREAAGLADAVRVHRPAVPARLRAPPLRGRRGAGLRFPSHGEISGALVRALGVGRPGAGHRGHAGRRRVPGGCRGARGPRARARRTSSRRCSSRLLADAGPARAHRARLARDARAPRTTTCDPRCERLAALPRGRCAAAARSSLRRGGGGPTPREGGLLRLPPRGGALGRPRPGPARRCPWASSALLRGLAEGGA